MKRLFYILLLAVWIGGCSLTGSHGGAASRDAEPVDDSASVASEARADTQPTQPALGDPTFESEVVEAAPDAAEPATEESSEPPADAVVATGPAAPEETPRNEDLVRGLALYGDGALRDARRALTAVLFAEASEEDEQAALETLAEINRTIFLAEGEQGDLATYEVQKGDTLGHIAKKHHTTWEMIQRLNGMKSTVIRVGQQLKVLKGEFSLVVRKERFVMDLLLDGAFIKRYDVGLGIGGSTPLGEFVIKNRIPEPADGSWPYGHEKHRLGSRWMGLKNGEGYKGYGIHGCRAEENDLIGSECSQGCVRLTNADVEELYDVVPTGAKVAIIER